MSLLTDSVTSRAAVDPIAIDEPTAARLTGLSGKTLSRMASAGVPVGRITVGRRVLYVRAVLEKWLESRLIAGQ